MLLGGKGTGTFVSCNWRLEGAADVLRTAKLAYFAWLSEMGVGIQTSTLESEGISTNRSLDGAEKLHGKLSLQRKKQRSKSGLGKRTGLHGIWKIS